MEGTAERGPLTADPRKGARKGGDVGMGWMQLPGRALEWEEP